MNSRPTIRTLCLLISAGLSAFGGCSRAWYRNGADEAVVEAVDAKGGDAELTALLVPDESSRLFDPFDPDRPPLPPDDPQSHQLMHSVDGMEGFDGWHDNGDVASVDTRDWLQYLPRNDDGQVVLGLDEAVAVARTNSRGYRRELEDLYLSALDVTFEQFRFDTMYFAGTGPGFGRGQTEFALAGRNRSSGPGSSELTVGSGVSAQQLSATGGEFVVGLANSLMFDFAGGQVDSLGSTLSFEIFQPLLRRGGRAVVLEGLTQSERTLLANVRQMEQFRQGFYVDIVAGANSGDGPNPGGAVGASGLGIIAGSPGGGRAGGYLGLLQAQQEIRNLERNVGSLRDSLALLEASFEPGLLSTRLQVDQARQALYRAQSRLLQVRASYASSIDAYAVRLGLPPGLPLRIQSELVDRFNLISPDISRLEEDLLKPLITLRSLSRQDHADVVTETLPQIAALRLRIDEQLEKAADDLTSIEPVLPERRRQLNLIRQRVDEKGDDVDPQIYDSELLTQRVEKLRERLPRLKQDFVTLEKSFEAIRETRDEDDPEAERKRVKALANEMSDRLQELSLFRAEARLEQITLVPVQVAWQNGVEIARQNRLDWMNARARLVDNWRQIELSANELESFLNVRVEGDMRTEGDNPIEFRAKNGRIRFGLELDTPITRIAERNAYRAQLIEYQRSRRDFMLFEDRVVQSVRNTVRSLELSQVNFEIARAAVGVAIAQVDLSRMRLTSPPPLGQNARFSPTTTRDLVSALSDLLDAQNDFLNEWVSYEVLRRLIDFELGTMQLDSRGVWIDPGEFRDSDRLPVFPPDKPAQPDNASLQKFDSARADSRPGKRTAGWKPTVPN